MSLPEDFSAEQYLKLHPDVRMAGVDPAQHYLAWGRGEERSYKRDPDSLNSVVEGVYAYDGLSSIHNHDFMSNENYIAAYARGLDAAGPDYKRFWHVHIGLWAARTAAKHAGDFVACGVNYGFLSSAIMKDLNWNRTGRTFYLLGSYASSDDQHLSEQKKTAGLDGERAYTSNIEAIKQNYAEWPKARVIQGSIPEALSAIDSQRIAYLHIDLNRTLAEVSALEFLWERLVPGAIILFENYACYGCQPQKDGMDQWAEKMQVLIASLPTGQGLLIKP